MFSKGSYQSNKEEKTIFGLGVKLTGTLKDSGPITIHGQVQGEVSSDQSIYIGAKAFVEGPLMAQTIIIAGRVEGEIKAAETLEINSTGRVSGSIQTANLIIQPGAVFNGKCSMEIKTPPPLDPEPKQPSIPDLPTPEKNNLFGKSLANQEETINNYEVEE